MSSPWGRIEQPQLLPTSPKILEVFNFHHIDKGCYVVGFKQHPSISFAHSHRVPGRPWHAALKLTRGLNMGNGWDYLT